MRLKLQAVLWRITNTVVPNLKSCFWKWKAQPLIYILITISNKGQRTRRRKGNSPMKDLPSVLWTCRPLLQWQQASPSRNVPPKRAFIQNRTTPRISPSKTSLLFPFTSSNHNRAISTTSVGHVCLSPTRQHPSLFRKEIAQKSVMSMISMEEY